MTSSVSILIREPERATGLNNPVQIPSEIQGDCVLVTNSSGRVTHASTAALSFFGCNASEIIGLYYGQLLTLGHVGKSQNDDDSVATGKRDGAAQVFGFARVGGRIRQPVEVLVRAIPDVDQDSSIENRFIHAAA